MCCGPISREATIGGKILGGGAARRGRGTGAAGPLIDGRLKMSQTGVAPNQVRVGRHLAPPHSSSLVTHHLLDLDRPLVDAYGQIRYVCVRIAPSATRSLPLCVSGSPTPPHSLPFNAGRMAWHGMQRKEGDDAYLNSVAEPA